MIRLIREGSSKHPWVLKLVMLGIAVTFIIGMGWFGYETAQQPNIVAVIGAYEVDTREFRQAYNTVYKRKRENKQEVVEDEIKQEILSSMVGEKLWLVAADDFEVDVHPDELRHAIMGRNEFRQDGSFDPRIYYTLLAQNRISPKQFEAQLAETLRRQKTIAIVRDAATLNAEDRQDVEELVAKQTKKKDDEADVEKAKIRIEQELLAEKQQRAALAFLTALQAATPIEVFREFL